MFYLPVIYLLASLTIRREEGEWGGGGGGGGGGVFIILKQPAKIISNISQIPHCVKTLNY